MNQTITHVFHQVDIIPKKGVLRVTFPLVAGSTLHSKEDSMKRIEVEIASQHGETLWSEPYLEAACLLFIVNTIMIESPSTVNSISISRLKKGAATE